LAGLEPPWPPAPAAIEAIAGAAAPAFTVPAAAAPAGYIRLPARLPAEAPDPDEPELVIVPLLVIVPRTWRGSPAVLRVIPALMTSEEGGEVRKDAVIE
jgi:hypothetical protein